MQILIPNTHRHWDHHTDSTLSLASYQSQAQGTRHSHLLLLLEPLRTKGNFTTGKLWTWFVVWPLLTWHFDWTLVHRIDCDRMQPKSWNTCTMVACSSWCCYFPFILHPSCARIHPPLMQLRIQSSPMIPVGIVLGMLDGAHTFHTDLVMYISHVFQIYVVHCR